MGLEEMKISFKMHSKLRKRMTNYCTRNKISEEYLFCRAIKEFVKNPFNNAILMPMRDCKNNNDACEVCDKFDKPFEYKITIKIDPIIKASLDSTCEKLILNKRYLFTHLIVNFMDNNYHCITVKQPKYVSTSLF